MESARAYYSNRGLCTLVLGPLGRCGRCFLFVALNAISMYQINYFYYNYSIFNIESIHVLRSISVYIYIDRAI